MSKYNNPFSVDHRKPVFIESSDPRYKGLEKYRSRLGRDVAVETLNEQKVLEKYKEPNWITGQYLNPATYLANPFYDYNGLDHTSSDWISRRFDSIKIDPNENIFGRFGVTIYTGNTVKIDGENYELPYVSDFYTISKLNRSGDVLKTIALTQNPFSSTDYAYDCMSVDKFGNVIAFYGIPSGYVITSLNNSLEINWSKKLLMSGSGWPRGIVDDDGNIYLIIDDSSLGDLDTAVAIIKYSKDGDFLFKKIIYNLALKDIGSFIFASDAVFANGLIYVLFQYRYGYETKICIFNTSGDLIQQIHTYFEANDIADALNLSVDRDGNMYLLGRTYLPSNIISGSIVVKINSSGEIEWDKVYHHPSIDYHDYGSIKIEHLKNGNLLLMMSGEEQDNLYESYRVMFVVLNQNGDIIGTPVSWKNNIDYGGYASSNVSTDFILDKYNNVYNIFEYEAYLDLDTNYGRKETGCIAKLQSRFGSLGTYDVFGNPSFSIPAFSSPLFVYESWPLEVYSTNAVASSTPFPEYLGEYSPGDDLSIDDSAVESVVNSASIVTFDYDVRYFRFK